MSAASDLLASVETAIATFVAGGAIRQYTLANGRTVMRESLKELREMRDALKEEVAMESDGGAAVRIGFRRGC